MENRRKDSGEPRLASPGFPKLLFPLQNHLVVFPAGTTAGKRSSSSTQRHRGTAAAGGTTRNPRAAAAAAAAAIPAPAPPAAAGAGAGTAAAATPPRGERAGKGAGPAPRRPAGSGSATTPTRRTEKGAWGVVSGRSSKRFIFFKVVKLKTSEPRGCRGGVWRRALRLW